MEPKRRASIQFAAQSGTKAIGGKQEAAAAAGDAVNLDPEQHAELAYLQLEQEWRAKLGLPELAPSTARSRSLTARSASTVAVTAK